MNNAIYRNKLLRTLRVNRSSKTFVVDRNIVIDSRNGSDGFECMEKKKKLYDQDTFEKDRWIGK